MRKKKECGKIKNKKPIIGFYYSIIIFMLMTTSLIIAGAIIVWLHLIGKLSFGVAAMPFIPVGWLYTASLLVGIVLSTFMVKNILGPLEALNNALKEVTKGNFDVHLPIRGRLKEVRNMSENFNIMVRELSMNESLKSDFISNVSHEIKTPIAAIEGYAMLLQGENQSDDEKNEYIDKILYNTKRVSALTGNILMISKLENQTIMTEQKLFSLDEQIRQSILLLEQRWTEKEIDLNIDLDSVEYYGSEDLLVHVWVNIIENAIKYSEVGGEIAITLISEDGAPKMTVSDKGAGMNSEVQNRVFEKFYQGDKSRHAEGNGLGLTLVKRILDLSKGEIAVTSAPERGTSVTVKLAANRA
jgi:Signal transduction histidine kinase